MFDPSLLALSLHLHSIQLPVILILLFGGLGLAGLLALYHRNRLIHEAAEVQFKDFRERAVGLMDQIDGLRNRHKTLPETDPDYTEGMQGETLNLYQKAGDDLDRLWERWLAVMEVWNRAEERMKSRSTFQVAPTEEARALLAGGGLEELLHASSDCKADLDRLNLAHEVAAKALKDARRESARFARKIDIEEARGGRSDLYARELRVVERELDDAERILTADPIAATSAIEQARDTIAELEAPSAPRRPRYNEPAATNSRTILDDLIIAAGRLQELTSKIRVIDIIGLLVKGWVVLWVLGLFLAILPALMPLILLFMAFVVFGSGFRVFHRLSAPWIWDAWPQPKKRKFGRKR